jgi:hypothetical protein
LSAPKNIGRNKWVINTPGEIQVSDDYLHILQLRSQNRWVRKYWSKELEKNTKQEKFHISSAQEILSHNFEQKYKNLKLTSNTSYTNLFLKTKTTETENKFSNLYDTPFINFLTRINNKKKA